MVGNRHILHSAVTCDAIRAGGDGRGECVVSCLFDTFQIGAYPVRHVVSLLRCNSAVIGNLIVIQADCLQTCQAK